MARIVPCGSPEFLLREFEGVIPNTRFEMTLHLWQIKMWALPCEISSSGVVKKYKPKSNNPPEIGSPSTRTCFD